MASIKRFALATAFALGLVCTASAADPAPATPEDPQLNRMAYSAIQRDQELADLNIGVRVMRGGSAVLWGTATKAEAAKAEALLKKLPGITSVVNTCDAAEAPDPLAARVEAAVKAAAQQAEPAKPEPAKTEVVKAEPAPPAISAGAPVSRHTTTVEKPRVSQSPSREPATRLLDPVAATPPVDYAAVEQVRRGDSRFARLTFDLRDGRVVISGSAADPAIAWELARKVAPLIGDRDVVVGKVKPQ